jgi:hypothetical protein
MIVRSNALEPIPTLVAYLCLIHTQLRASAPIMTDSSAVLRSIAPLLRSSALAETTTFVSLVISRTYLCSSASLLATPTDPRQYVQFFFFNY